MVYGIWCSKDAIALSCIYQGFRLTLTYKLLCDLIGESQIAKEAKQAIKSQVCQVVVHLISNGARLLKRDPKSTVREPLGSRPDETRSTGRTLNVQEASVKEETADTSTARNISEEEQREEVRGHQRGIMKPTRKRCIIIDSSDDSE